MIDLLVDISQPAKDEGYFFAIFSAYRPLPAASICFWIFSRLNDPGVRLGGRFLRQGGRSECECSSKDTDCRCDTETEFQHGFLLSDSTASGASCVLQADRPLQLGGYGRI
jgi:hypothetical protein